MKKKAVLFLSGFIVSVVFLLVSCQPAATTETTSVRPLATTSKNTMAPSTTTVAVERPQYGGTLNLISLLDIGVFDPVATGQFMGMVGWFVNEQYLGEDWSRGPAGTGEIDWVPNVGITPNNCTGILAESWEMPEVGTIVFKVRQGVHWAFNPNSEASRLMNGREVTADDWIASFDFFMHHVRSPVNWAPQIASTATMEETGPWEVTLKTPVDSFGGWNTFAGSSPVYFLLPPDVVQKYGDMHDWHNVVGTGPFMLTDYVSSSSATLERNPDYWMKESVGAGSGDQLPYLDRIKILVITDVSTQLAALRTGKTDTATGIASEDAKGLIGSIPALNYRSFLPLFSTLTAMRIDKADLPYKDKRVRQALMLATDFGALKDGFYAGDAEIFAFPVTRESPGAYIPLDEMPGSARSLFQYDPDRARQLLAEAGYPNGFDASMMVLNGLGSTDLAAVYKGMWEKVGINLELQPKEQVVFSSIGYSRAYEDMMLIHIPGGTMYPSCLNLPYLRGPASSFYIDDPVLEAARDKIQMNALVDTPEANRLYRELLPYLVEKAYYIPSPTPIVYCIWWPWLHNRYGQLPIRFATHYWIDQNLKQQMTGRR
jgi:peptide/nickel transport system substrate-binding protein